MSLYQSFAIEGCYSRLLVNQGIYVVILHRNFSLWVQIMHGIRCSKSLIVLAQVVIVHNILEFAYR